jgi:SAM-dependent methyltransferase|tara:strand:+ start:915 stop:1712 length:798 start_codon:yes stop_codon:yes gene_type:complete
MLAIEEIKLLIEKLERVKEKDLQKLIDENLKILKDLAMAVDANNNEIIDRMSKTPQWFERDLVQKRKNPVVDPWLFEMVKLKISQFTKAYMYHCLEIGPGTGMFSKEFRPWRKNYFLDILPDVENKIRRRFKPAEQRNLLFYLTRETNCQNIPQGSCNFIFSWDTFVYFTQSHIQQYLHDIKRVLIPGGYCFIQYADCHYDIDLREAKRGYWSYNTRTAMEKIIIDEGYEIVEMNQFRPGANYAIFRKPGKQNPAVYKVSEIKID